MVYKENLSEIDEVRSRVLEGTQKMFDMISPTLGPDGLSALIDRGTGEPLLVDDGRRILENIKLDDPVQQKAVRTCYGSTRKTDEKVGDGSCTATILAHGFLEDIFKNHLPTGIGQKSAVGEIERRMEKDKDFVLKRLDELAKPVKTLADLENTATICAGREDWGKMIAGMYWEMGKDAHINLELNLTGQRVEHEVVKGYRFSGGYNTPWALTDPIRGIAKVEDAYILITKQEINDFKGQLKPIAEQLASNGVKQLVIIAPKYSKNVLEAMYTNAQSKAPFFFVGVQAPGRNEGAYQDMAVFSAGKYFSPNDDISEATVDELGRARFVEIGEDTCIIGEGFGKDADIKKRIKEVEADMDKQSMHQFKKDRLERISALGGVVGVIKIGAPTDEAMNWARYKIEDARYATKHAFQTGVVPGGGSTLKKIAEELPDDSPLKAGLLLPTKVLKRNNGGKALKVGKNVLDPVAVEKAGVTYACAAVAKLMRIGVAIVYREPKLEEKIAKLLNPNESEG